MTTMSSRERLLRTFRREPTDRMPYRIWGVDPDYPSDRPSYAPLYDFACEFGLDLIRNWRPQPPRPAAPAPEPTRTETPDGEMWEAPRVMNTPEGPLTSVSYVFKDGRPGYVKKHFVETVADAKKWLSIPLREPQFETDSYRPFVEKTGDKALVMVSIGHAMYGVENLMGSETFGFWLMDERELLREMIDKSFRTVEATLKRYLDAGVGELFGWVGPELCIPPLASPRDFDEFVTPYDGRLCDMIHDAGALVWVHCHGDMGPVLERFADMGVDCLNPIEPPPCGSLTLAEAKERIGGRMSLDGGVQDGIFDNLTPEEIERVVEETVAQGKPGGGFILCPTSGPSTRHVLTDQHVANYRAYCKAAARLSSYD